jgi:short-subunit dehydrogenase
MKTAVVTGASAGLGAEFARQVAPEVDRIVLVARRLDRLELLCAELWQQKTTLLAEARVVDLSDATQVQGLVDWLKSQEIDILINNAGFGDVGLFESSVPDKIQDMLRVNVEALTCLTQAVVPGMIARGQGRILNVSSSAGVLPLPSFAVYGATKAYVTSFSEALRAELKKTGVTVTYLCPGPVETEFGKMAERPNGKREFNSPKMAVVSAEEVVRQACAAMHSGKARVIPGVGVRLFYWFAEVMPWIFWRAIFSLGKMR